MNNLYKIIKHQLLGFRKSVFILTLVMVAIGLFFEVATISAGENNNGSFSGFELTFAIFLFIGFITSFKTDFNHLNVSGVTRKSFFMGNLITTVAASICMLVLYWLLDSLYMLLGINSQTLISGLYNSSSAYTAIVFAMSLFLLASMGGWLLGLLGYRYGTPMIIALSVSPAIIFTVIPFIAVRFNFMKQLIDAVAFYFGLFKQPAPLQASLNFLITAVVIAFINWLLIRKLSVKM